MDDRRAIWTLVLAGLAFVVAVVGLLIAIGAKNGNTSDAELANAVRTEISKDVPQLRAALASQSEAVAAAGARLRQAEREQRRLAGGQAVDRGDLNRLSSQIKALQGDVNTLTNDVNSLQNGQDRTRNSLDTLTRRVNRLEDQVANQKQGK
ncbi:MAG: hypothetical protein U0R52_02070 [Solirubrobacterales bacterium]